eukprot:157022_1
MATLLLHFLNARCFSTIQTKECAVCGVSKLLSQYYNRRMQCKPCYQSKRNTRNRFLGKLCSNAKQRKKGYDLSKEYLEYLWQSQNGLCTLSGIPMVHKANSDWKCSLERLNNNLGYFQGNVSLICQEFNTFKQWNQQMIITLPSIIRSSSHFQNDISLLNEVYLLHDQIGKRTRKLCLSCNTKIKNKR